MKQEVTLTEQEVNQALLDYAEKHGVRFESMSATVTVVAGRGDRGVYATIAIEPNNIPLVKKDVSQIDEYIKTPIYQENTIIHIDESVPVEVESVDADVDDEDSIFG